MIETSPTPMISDELLHALAEQYLLLHIGHYGIAFDEYLADPARAHERLQDPDGHWPLLPAQQVVQERLDTADETAADEAERELMRQRPDCACRGGAFVEPLHHHAWGHDRRRSIFRRQGGES